MKTRVTKRLQIMTVDAANRLNGLSDSEFVAALRDFKPMDATVPELLSRLMQLTARVHRADGGPLLYREIKAANRFMKEPATPKTPKRGRDE